MVSNRYVPAKRKSAHTPQTLSLIIIVSLGLAVLIGIAYLANNTLSSQAATAGNLSGSELEQILPGFTSISDQSDVWNWDNRTDPWLMWLVVMIAQSEYPPCRLILEQAYKDYMSNPDYIRLKEVKAEIDAMDLYKKNYWWRMTDQEKQEWRIKRDKLWAEYQTLLSKLDKTKSQVIAAYNACIASEKKKIEKWWRGRMTGDLTKVMVNKIEDNSVYNHNSDTIQQMNKPWRNAYRVGILPIYYQDHDPYKQINELLK